MYAYNPRKKSHEQLESSLVGADRWDILNGILKELALKKGEAPKQHWMIVGARGMGKSHLLTLLHHKICADKKLSKLWIPVLFPEEIRMAGDLARFLERAVAEVQRDLEREKHKFAGELKDKISKIRSVRHDERVDYLLSVVSWIRQATGRYILLIAENLQQLLGKKLSLIEQKKLRAYLQSDESLLLVGSATTIFDALHDHSHPFYHFFHIRRLDDLSFEDVKVLVEGLLSNHEKKERSQIIVENEPRLRVLYLFTGGNPRMAVFLSDILKTNVNEEMMEIMDNILDELTPYFEAIINDTPEYLQEIINCLAAYEPAQSPKEIAEHLEMEQATVRNYLKQAKENGYVKIAFSKGKSNYYCLNEYLYRAWYQMRDSSRRDQMRWMIELMLLLYSKEFIQMEKERIVLLEQDDTGPYRLLLEQTYEFMCCNPRYCAIIDLCMEQGNKYNNADRVLDEIIEKRIEVFKKDMKLALEHLLENTELRKIDFFDELYEIFVRKLLLGVGIENIEANVTINSLAIAFHLKGTFDIEFAVKKYAECILPFIANIDQKVIEILTENQENETEIGMLIHWNALRLDYAAVVTLLDSSMPSDTSLLLLSMYLVIVQMIHFAITKDWQRIIVAYDALLCMSSALRSNKVVENEAIFYYIVFGAFGLGLFERECVDKIFEIIAPKSDKAQMYSLLWICLGYPDSESAQKLIAEPPMAELANNVRDTFITMKDQYKRRGSLPAPVG